MGIYIPGLSHKVSFASFSHAKGNDRKPMHFPCDEAYKYTIGWGHVEEKQPYYEKSISIGTNFPGSPHMMGFATFSYIIRN